MKKEFNILKKPYLPPRVEFEEIEADEREMLMMSTDDGSGDDYGSGESQGGGDDRTDPNQHSLDLDFSMDFVVNDEPQL